MNLLAQTESTIVADEPRRSFAQALLDALPMAALVADARGRIAALNPQAELFLGWSTASIQLHPVHDILECRMDDTGEPADDCPVTRLLSGSTLEPEGRMWVRCRDDNLRPVQFRCTPFPTAGGTGVILTFKDLTRQLELERDLRRLACIAEESPIAIVELNADGNMIHANPAMMQLVQRFGFSSEARPAILPAEIIQLTAQCLKQQNELAGVEVQLGDTYYEWKLTPVPHAKLVRGYGIDLTERKRVELELVDAKIRAEAASAAKSEFLANTSHELRSPIHVVLGMADLLAQSDLSEEQRMYLKTLRSSAEGLMTVMGDILDMAALDAGSIRLEADSLEFHAFLRKHIEPWVRRAQDKGLGLQLLINKGVPLKVQCDYKRLGQLLNKLLSNAVKFTDSGQIVVEADRGAICSKTVRRGKKKAAAAEEFSLFVTIKDSGIGIPRAKQEAIFSCFTQADGSTSRSYEGAGLGLSIAKQLVELMGGRIGVESEPGQGSKFWFTVPMAEIC
ncbi:MAG: PAS domain-containing protein [Deltaproteobacteria bacterium]|nr:PAS domain-containing protein [Deltaproteobacteria bacterium]